MIVLKIWRQRFINIYMYIYTERDVERPLYRNWERVVREIIMFTTHLWVKFTPQFGLIEE